MKRVLVVDDTKNIRVLLTKCLELEGYEVLTAKDGQDALELFESESFDLAFIDIKMPLLSGTEVLKKIRESGIKTPVIIITAYATIKNAVECTQLGAVAYLQKPFTADKVRSVLRELILPGGTGDDTAAVKAENRFEQIESFLERRDFSKAADMIKKTISEEPANPYPYLLLSKAYRGMGDFEPAEKFLRIYELLNK
jgi:two-component system OmpR family response regulator